MTSPVCPKCQVEVTVVLSMGWNMAKARRKVSAAGQYQNMGTQAAEVNDILSSALPYATVVMNLQISNNIIQWT